MISDLDQYIYKVFYCLQEYKLIDEQASHVMPKNWSKWKIGNTMIYNLEIILFTYYFLSVCNTLEIRNIDCILQVRLKNWFLSKLFRAITGPE